MRGPTLHRTLFFGSRRRRAFTLVELLVVVGIIALLIGILLPVLNRARAAANRAVCLSNIRQLGVGILMYCNDNRGWFPTCAIWDEGTAYKPYADDWIHWQANRRIEESAIAKYLGGGEQFKQLLRCPADNPEGRKARVGILPGQGPYLYSYGMNDAIGENVRSGQLRTKISWWRAPWRKILLTEVLETYNTAPVWDYAGELAWRHGTAVSRGNYVLAPGNRMGRNVSTAFIDGHAEGIDDDFACNIYQIRPRMQ
jgi:prepilin-type N-terminal cleavage/methylation domain-containing protein